MRWTPTSRSSRPWRDWEFKSRTDLLDFAEKHQIPVTKDKRGEAPFSVDANLLHSSSEGKVLEDPAESSPALRLHAHRRPEDAPDQATIITDRLRERRSGLHQRQGDEAARRCWRRSTISAATTASAASTSSRTASSA